MITRNPLLTLVLALGLLFVLGDSALAQRGGRNSGRQTSGSTGGSRSSSRGTTPSRSTPSRSTPRPSRSTPSRNTTPSRSAPSSSPSRSTSRPSSSSSRSRYTPPTTTPRRTTPPSRTTTRPSSPPAPSSRMPAYTPPTRPEPTPSPSTYDLSRRSSSPTAQPSTLEDATIRFSNRPTATTRGSTVPKAYGSRRSSKEARSTRGSAGSRREALSRGLRDSTSVAGRRGESPEGIAKTYTPSRNRDRGRSAKARSIDPDRIVLNPGETQARAIRQIQAERESERAAQAAAGKLAKRIKNARETKQAKEQRLRRMRLAYNEATRRDPELRKRLEGISRVINRATDVGIRSVTGMDRAGSVTPAGTGTTPGGDTTPGDDPTGDHYVDDHWDDPYYHCHSWYWSHFFPGYCNWWFGYWGWGWSFGWGWGWGYYSPYYSPYGYWRYAPAYCYVDPPVIYNYTINPEPVREETVVYVETPPVTADAPATSDVRPLAPRTFGDRAAAEYMALGDQAFTEGRYGDAVHYYAKSIQFAPEDGVLYLVLSDALFATGDYHYAAFAIRRALEFNPELASLGLDKRTFYGQPEEFDEQLATLAKFVEDHPIDRDARLVLAANYLFSLKAEEAVKTLDAAPGGPNPNSKSSQLLLAAATGMLAD